MPRGIFLIFLAVGVAIAGGSSLYYAMAWSWVLEGRSWPTAQGTIQAVDVEDRNSGSENSHSVYYPRLAYTYRVGNRILNGERIWLTGNQFYNHREDAVAFVGQYAVGQKVPVLYDPQDPEEAALLNEAPPWQILLFTAAGLGWIALSLYFRLRDPVPKRRFGRCRKCGARLPFDEHRPPGGAPCPRCNQPDPLASWGNRKPLILFFVLFFGIWAVGLYLLFG